MENLYTIGRLFSDRMFRVPDYQRGYAWEEQQCQDFIEDLELVGEGQEHFFGLLILQARSRGSEPVVDHKGHAYRVYDVIDGQQRLTTVVLLLDAIRREMEQFEELQTLASGLQETFIVTPDRHGFARPKLTLNRDTHQFFYGTVLGQEDDIVGATIRSHELLRQASAHFDAYLDERRRKLEEGYADWLRDQYLKITQRLTVVVYTVKSESDAGGVFETMNNRGKDLTELEKVKNYLLYLAGKLNLPEGHGLQDKINDTWTHIFESLMAADLGDVRNEDRLLRAHWLMAYDHDARNWDGSRSIKDRFNLRGYQGRHRDLLEDLTAYLTSLRNATVAYCDVYNPTHPAAFKAFDCDGRSRSRIVKTAERFARLGTMANFLPFLLAARLEASTDGHLYQQAIDLCERFVFRVHRWMGYRANTGRSRVLRIAHRFYSGQNAQRALDDLRRAILRYCPNQRFAARFEQEDVDWFRWWGLKYFLYDRAEEEWQRKHNEALEMAVFSPIVPTDQESERSAQSLEEVEPIVSAGTLGALRQTSDNHTKLQRTAAGLLVLTTAVTGLLSACGPAGAVQPTAEPEQPPATATEEEPTQETEQSTLTVELGDEEASVGAIEIPEATAVPIVEPSVGGDLPEWANKEQAQELARQGYEQLNQWSEAGKLAELESQASAIRPIIKWDPETEGSLHTVAEVFNTDGEESGWIVPGLEQDGETTVALDGWTNEETEPLFMQAPEGMYLLIRRDSVLATNGEGDFKVWENGAWEEHEQEPATEVPPAATSEPTTPPTEEIETTSTPTEEAEEPEPTEETTDTPEVSNEWVEISKRAEAFKNGGIPEEKYLFEEVEIGQVGLEYRDYENDDVPERGDLQLVLLGTRQIDEYQVLIVGSEHPETRRRVVVPLIIGNDNSINLNIFRLITSPTNTMYATQHQSSEQITPEEALVRMEQVSGRPFALELFLTAYGDILREQGRDEAKIEDMERYFFPHISANRLLFFEPTKLEEQVGDISDPSSLNLDKAPVNWGAKIYVPNR
jgi:hypothetical protein